MSKWNDIIKLTLARDPQIITKEEYSTSMHFIQWFKKNLVHHEHTYIINDVSRDRRRVITSEMKQIDIEWRRNFSSILTHVEFVWISYCAFSGDRSHMTGSPSHWVFGCTLLLVASKKCYNKFFFLLARKNSPWVGTFWKSRSIKRYENAKQTLWIL